MANTCRADYSLDDLKFDETLGFQGMDEDCRPCVHCVEKVHETLTVGYHCDHRQSPVSYLQEGRTIVGVKIPDIFLGPAQALWNSVHKSETILTEFRSSDTSKGPQSEKVDRAITRALAAWKALILSAYNSDRLEPQLTSSLQLQETAAIREVLFLTLLITSRAPLSETRGERNMRKVMPPYILHDAIIEELRGTVYLLGETVTEAEKILNDGPQDIQLLQQA